MSGKFTCAHTPDCASERAHFVLVINEQDARIAELEALLWDVCGYETATAALPLSLCARIDAALGTDKARSHE